MEKYGVYGQKNDLHIWSLESIVSRETAELLQDLKTSFGFQVLIVGPLEVFNKFLET